jgi:hypothetical protein
LRATSDFQLQKNRKNFNFANRCEKTVKKNSAFEELKACPCPTLLIRTPNQNLMSFATSEIEKWYGGLTYQGKLMWKMHANHHRLLDGKQNMMNKNLALDGQGLLLIVIKVQKLYGHFTTWFDGLSFTIGSALLGKSYYLKNTVRKATKKTLLAL